MAAGALTDSDLLSWNWSTHGDSLGDKSSISNGYCEIIKRLSDADEDSGAGSDIQVERQNCVEVCEEETQVGHSLLNCEDISEESNMDTNETDKSTDSEEDRPYQDTSNQDDKTLIAAAMQMDDCERENTLKAFERIANNQTLGKVSDSSEDEMINNETEVKTQGKDDTLKAFNRIVDKSHITYDAVDFEDDEESEEQLVEKVENKAFEKQEIIQPAEQNLEIERETEAQNLINDQRSESEASEQDRSVQELEEKTLLINKETVSSNDQDKNPADNNNDEKLVETTAAAEKKEKLAAPEGEAVISGPARVCLTLGAQWKRRYLTLVEESLYIWTSHR